jgi:hypothetical protein
MSLRAEPQVSDGENLAHEMGDSPLPATAARFTGSVLTSYAPGVALAKPRSPQALCFRPLRGLEHFGCGFSRAVKPLWPLSLCGESLLSNSNHGDTEATEVAQRRAAWAASQKEISHKKTEGI